MTTKPQTNEILDEIRAIRDQMARECGYDIRKLGETLMKSQKRHGSRLVNLAPEKPASAPGSKAEPPDREA